VIYVEKGENDEEPRKKQAGMTWDVESRLMVFFPLP
jgi:hypothetical protein